MAENNKNRPPRGPAPTTSQLTACERVTEAVEHATGAIRTERGYVIARCPSHNDRNPSLSIKCIEGSVLIYCFAGCSVDAVLNALHMTKADLYDNRRGAEYRYDSGRTVHRTPDKKFWQTGDTSTVDLYHLSRLQATQGPVYLVEGEKDVHTLESMGAVATTAPMGASNFNKVDLTPLQGRDVIAVVDNDVAGVKWAGDVEDLLKRVVRSLQFVEAATGKDAADHIAAGHGLDDFINIGGPIVNDDSGASDASGPSGALQGGSMKAPEDGAGLLDEVRDWLGRFITVMRDSDLDVLVTWAAHTHAGTRLRTTPRLQIDSPVPESGKTTVLEHLQRLCYRPVVASSISSAALLARLVADEPRTLLLDEVDRTLDVKKTPIADEFLAVLNSGYKVGGSRPVLVPSKGGQWIPEEMSTFTYVTLAGNQPNLPDDTRSRIIRVLLLPDWSGRAEESDWELIEEQALALGERLALWVAEADLSYRAELPPGCTGRFREKWLPLSRIAHAAGGRWPKAVWELAADDVEQTQQDREEGLATEKPAVLLLRHINKSWPVGQEFWRTMEMVPALINGYPESWGQFSTYGKALTKERLGKMLTGAFQIRSSVLNHADKNSPRGYWQRQFSNATVALTRSGASTTPPLEAPEASEASEAPEEPRHWGVS